MADEDLLKRYSEAAARRDQWRGLLDEAYRFAAPNLDSGFQGISAEGARRMTSVFDSGPITDVEEAAKALLATLVPPYEPWFRLVPPDDILAAMSNDEALGVQAGLDRETDAIHAELSESNFYPEVRSAFVQVKISTGALVFNIAEPGEYGPRYRFACVPQSQLAPETDHTCRLRTVWRCRKWPGDAILRLWPEAEIPSDLAKKIAENPRDQVELVDGAIADDDRGDYRIVVLLKGEAASGVDSALLFEERQETSPFILFREQTVLGEAFGRGAVLNVLPDIRTLNKAVELVLKNASIAIAGIWQAEDDGIIDPTTIRLVPGAIIPKAVGSQGLTPLLSPGRFDIAELVIGELRDRIRRSIIGRELPALERRRDVTATEMDHRWSDVQMFRVPDQLAVWHELVPPLIDRALMARRMVGEPGAMIRIGRAVRAIPTGRLAAMKEMADVIRAQQALTAVASVMPDALGKAVKPTLVASWMLRKAAFPAELMTTEDEQKAAAREDRLSASLMQLAEGANKVAPVLREMKDAG